MYPTDPFAPTALAATGITAAYGFVTVAVLVFAGAALITIARQLRHDRATR